MKRAASPGVTARRPPKRALNNNGSGRVPGQTPAGIPYIRNPDTVEFARFGHRLVQSNNLPATLSFRVAEEWNGILVPGNPASLMFRIARRTGLPVCLGNTQPVHGWVSGQGTNVLFDPRGKGSIAGLRTGVDLATALAQVKAMYGEGVAPCAAVCVMHHNKSTSVITKPVDLGRLSGHFLHEPNRFSGANGCSLTFQEEFGRPTSVVIQWYGNMFVLGANSFAEAAAIAVYAQAEVEALIQQSLDTPLSVSKAKAKPPSAHPRVGHMVVHVDEPVRQPVSEDLIWAKFRRVGANLRSTGNLIPFYNVLEDEGTADGGHEVEFGEPAITPGRPKKLMVVCTNESSSRVIGFQCSAVTTAIMQRAAPRIAASLHGAIARLASAGLCPGFAPPPLPGTGTGAGVGVGVGVGAHLGS